jgi:hypothetical protein
LVRGLLITEESFMSRTIMVLASLALVMAACGPSSNSVPPQNDAGGADRTAQHDSQQDSPVQEDGPAQHDGAEDGPVQEDGPGQQDSQLDAPPATLYADIRYLQQDPSLTGLAPLNGRVRIEGAVVTAVKINVNRFFIQNATGPKEYSGILVKRSAVCPTDLAIGDTLSAIEGTLYEESVFCDIDASVCPMRHTIGSVTVCARGASATVPTPLDVTGATIVATPTKYDGVLVHLTDSPLTVGTQPDGGVATTTPLSNGMSAYGQFYSPPGVVPSGTTVTTCIGPLDPYSHQWEIYPRDANDLVFADWPPDAGIQSDSGQSDGQQDSATAGDAASLPDGGVCTTGAPVVISQVYGAGGNASATYQNDFVELFNRTMVDINLSGWSVQYASSAGTAWQVTNLSGTIPAGKYFLVAEAAGAGCADGGTHPCGNALPTADVTGVIPMGAAAGKVALVAGQAALSGACPTGTPLVDLVGYGTATCYEGGAAAAAPSTSNSDQRGSAGCSDTNVNGTDFSAAAVSPRSSATAVNLCSGC